MSWRDEIDDLQEAGPIGWFSVIAIIGIFVAGVIKIAEWIEQLGTAFR